MLGKKGGQYRLTEDRDGMMSQASYPTLLDGEDQASSVDGNLHMRENGTLYNSESGFESLDPVHEDDESNLDEDEVLLNISPNKYEKPKD